VISLWGVCVQGSSLPGIQGECKHVNFACHLGYLEQDIAKAVSTILFITLIFVPSALKMG
jgi:hypothetical protein